MGKAKKPTAGRTEIRLGGFGGQGIVTAGYLLGKAAILEGKHAVLTKAYGPQIRGGWVLANLIIAQEPIDYPEVRSPDILICFAQDAYERLRPDLQPQGMILFDRDLVSISTEEKARAIGIPAQQLAEQLGKRVVSNNVMLGLLIASTQIVSKETLERALAETVSPQFRELNLRALEVGFAHSA